MLFDLLNYVSLMNIEKNIVMILWNVGTYTKTQCSILEDESSVCLCFIFVGCCVRDIFAPVNSSALSINAITLTTGLTIYAVLW